MPEFIPQRDSVAARIRPAELAEMVQGYLAAAEWLLDDESEPEEGGIDRDKVRGWSRDAQKEAKADCRDFLKAQAADIAIYCKESGRDMSSVGHDFWLSRNGHGAGFFDRGNHPVFDRLQAAARIYGGADVWCDVRGWLRFQ
jgi:hypothetical protein